MIWKKPKINQIATLADVKNRIREFFMDTQSTYAPQMSLNIGCVPLSDELMEKEEEESDSRVERISYTIPLLFSFANLYSKAMIIESDLPEEKMSPELISALKNLEHEIRTIVEENLANALVGAVSQLVDLDLLTIPKGRR